METVEIRVSKIKALPVFALLVVSFFVLIWHCFFSGEITSDVMKIIYGITMLPLAYLLYRYARTIFSNQPFLILHKSGIDIPGKGGVVSFLWLQVTHWNIEKDRQIHRLSLETTDGKRSINISQLDKNPAEIERLMQQYKPK